MSVRVVRTRNGEDVICDLYEVTTKNEPNTPVAFQLSDPYNVWLEGLDEPRLLAENEAGEEMQKISDPEIHFNAVNRDPVSDAILIPPNGATVPGAHAAGHERHGEPVLGPAVAPGHAARPQGLAARRTRRRSGRSSSG